MAKAMTTNAIQRFLISDWREATSGLCFEDDFDSATSSFLILFDG
jgi:hypothetical protein